MLPMGGDTEAYLFGNWGDLYGNYRFFYRAPDHSTLQPMPLDPTDPTQGNFCWCDLLPGGYTPYLEGDQYDFSSSAGLRGAFR